MDFDDTPEEAAFRETARAFLAANAVAKSASALAYKGRYSVDAEMIARARDWQRTKAEHGFAGLTWPVQWGGRGLPVIMQIIYAEEERGFAVPQGVFEIGLSLCLPTVLRFARPDVAARHAAPALRGEEIWCQLFSEPAAGSDLAGLRTMAEPDGDGWIVNGQKTWTSGASIADFGLLLARTNRDVPKHAGLTAFVLDMRAPGVTVRPIRQMSGHSHYSEVFLEDVRIVGGMRLGAAGQGWEIANFTLSNERYATGESPGPHVGDVRRLLRQLDEAGLALSADTAVRERVAGWHAREQALRYTRYRILTALSRGETPGFEASIGKLVSSALLQELTAFATDLLGTAAGVSAPDDVPMRGWLQEALLYAPANRIAGGTDEILRNILAERALGLPPEPRADRGVPFKDLPKQ